MFDRLSIAGRLWLAIGAFSLILVALYGAAAWGSNHTAAQEQVHAERRARIVTSAGRWAGLTESNVQRVVASVVGADAAVAQHFAPAIKATTAQINDLQKDIEALADSAPEQAQLARVGAARKTYIAAREAAVALRGKGDPAAAQQQLQTVVLPAVAAYLDEQRKFVTLQESLQDEARAAATQARHKVLYAAGAAVAGLVLLLGLAGAALVRSITRPLRQAAEASRRIGDGDLTVQVDERRRDEVGDMLRAVAGMRDSLRTVVSRVREATHSIQHASSEVAQGNVDLSQRTEQAAASLQQTAGAMEQLTGTVRQTADSARTADQLAASASSVAARGGDVVSQVVATMDEINGSSKKIADIIGTIDGIAFQTNILALNAAVEAARAGEQGRGFAVVAGEVRSLAQRSATAAREIKALIGASVERVEQGSRLVRDAGATMGEIVGSVRRVSDIIGEISSASEEQSGGIGSVNGAMAQLDQATQQNAALVEESAAAAAQLSEQARHLAELVSGFRLGDNPRPALRSASDTTAQVLTQARRTAGASAPVHKAAPRPAAAPAASAVAAAPAAATTADDADWQTF